MGDDMKKFYKIVVIISYLLSLFILLFCIKIRLTSNLNINPNFRLILLLIVCILIYIAGFILVKKLDYSKKILKINLVIYVLIYTVTIFMLTLFDELYGRRGLVLIEWDSKLIKSYIKYSFNIVPFTTVKLFINGYNNGLVSFKDFLINIVGNLCAFMPYALFLPLIFKRMEKYKNFFIVMIIIVAIIEILQFITMSGSCDIDDLILNVAGASLVYFICKISFIRKIIYKVFFLE